MWLPFISEPVNGNTFVKNILTIKDFFPPPFNKAVFDGKVLQRANSGNRIQS